MWMADSEWQMAKADSTRKSKVSNTGLRSTLLFALSSLSGLCVSVLKPMSDYRLLISGLCALLLALSLSAEAQQPARIPRIGYVSGTGSRADPGPYVEALRQGLRDLGYIDGKNITIEYRGAEGKAEPVPGIVAELVQLNVDVLVGINRAGALAAQRASDGSSKKQTVDRHNMPTHQFRGEC